MRDLREITVFHDERGIRKKWLYHSFVLCEKNKLQDLWDKLIDSKNNASCNLGERIHFSDLRSKSNISSKTRTAVNWANLFRNELYNYSWFYLLGIDLKNIDYTLFAKSKSKSGIYNTFFEIGLFSACRYFFDFSSEDVEILKICCERRSIKSSDPFMVHAPYRINRRETNVKVKDKTITLVDSTPSKEKKHPEFSHILNFVDVLIGSFSQVLDYTSNSPACNEVAEKVYSICRRLSENPYNPNSLYYKRYAMSYFPIKAVNRSDLCDYGASPPKNLFYTSRKLRLYQPKCLNGFEELID